MRITQARHPLYKEDFDSGDFRKWRLTYEGGRRFIDEYLQRFSKREDDVAFKERRKFTYCPAFAKAAINKLKNTLYSRMGEIKRVEGPDSYKKAVNGEGGGVDLYGSSMDTFIGQDVLAELMTMRRVGIYVDRKGFSDDRLLSRNRGNQPYLYYYCAEDILTWDFSYYQGEYIYTNVLLRDTQYEYDDATGVIIGQTELYRHVWLAADEKVHVQFYKPNDDRDADFDIKVGNEIVLDMPRIPFIVGEINHSLLVDAADYQAGMLNIASADLGYCYKANFPFYTEQYDPTSESVYTRGALPPQIGRGNSTDPAQGTFLEAQKASSNEERRAGVTTGVKYPSGMDRPDFIAPPTAPLIASMQKQEQMKSEIYELIDVALSTIAPMHASAESKQMDNQGAESGLAFLGLELQYMEREIAKVWAYYENDKPATVTYPKKYMLKSDAQRNEEAKQLKEVKTAIPSKTGAKEVSKQIAEVMLADKVTPETLEKIKQEIDDAEFISSEPDLIKTAAELGMVDAVTGSNALGFDGKKVVPIAQKEHAERMAETLKAQAAANPAARGDKDGAPIAGGKQEAKKEKTGKKRRGPSNGTSGQ